MQPGRLTYWVVLLLASSDPAFAQNYPDQYYALRAHSLLHNVESSDGMIYAIDSAGFLLQQDRLNGYII